MIQGAPWRQLWLGAALAVLAGCVMVPKETLRDQSAPFGATTRFDAARFAGDWYEVGILGAGTRPFLKRRYDLLGPDLLAMRIALPERLDAATADGAVIYRVTAPGRLLPQGADAAGQTIWVLWVDEGFRTAILGSPSGSGTVILDRRPVPTRDRMQAAREILEWYGYDMSKLRDTE